MAGEREEGGGRRDEEEEEEEEEEVVGAYGEEGGSLVGAPDTQTPIFLGFLGIHS